MNTHLILASNSPRRRELLEQIGVNYCIQTVDIDETPHLDELPLHYVERLAAEKSAACLKVRDDLPILAADTSVVLNNVIMGKPKNQEDAFDMLTCLSGQTHEVYTAISLRGKQFHEQALSITHVTFRELTQLEILNYWETGEPHDKAGSYAIQGKGSVFIKHISGSFSGVMGLPLFETAQLLVKQGILLL